MYGTMLPVRCYAVCGTDSSMLLPVNLRAAKRRCMGPNRCYARLGYAAIGLRACYAMSGTDIGDAAISAMRCRVLT
eukprot:964964-Rhodomonas_salina.2